MSMFANSRRLRKCAAMASVMLFAVAGCAGATPSVSAPASRGVTSHSATATATAIPSAVLTASPHGSFSSTGSMSSVRFDHTATLLASGKVLITGGDGLASAELYDPATGSFSSTGSMSTARIAHTATMLASGKVLITGGTTGGIIPSVLASAELYDPATGSFSSTGSMSIARDGHTATLLNSGKVLITGGCDSSSCLASAALYDPANGSFSSTGSMSSPRYGHTATMLASGKVLIAGGAANNLGLIWASAELYDPATGSFSSTGAMSSVRFLHTATLLASGKVLITGGQHVAGANWASAELYNP